MAISTNEAFEGLHIPSRRTIDEIAAEVSQRDSSGEWSLSLPWVDPEDAAILLPVLAELIERSGWRVHKLTVAEAEWIVRLRLTVPDLPAVDALSYARRYLARKPGSTGGLDRELALRGWEVARDVEDHHLKTLVAEGRLTAESAERFKAAAEMDRMTRGDYKKDEW